MEQRVSTVIGRMPFLFLALNDDPGPESLRGFIEKNAIALLSNAGKRALDPPSKRWLGHHCPRERVRESGLWNQNHVHMDYQPSFLNALKEAIDMKVLR